MEDQGLSCSQNLTGADGEGRQSKHSTRRIDLAVCAIMAHSVAGTVDPGLPLYWFEGAISRRPVGTRAPATGYWR